MNIIENIKAFFKEKGLNWIGKIATSKDDDFRDVTPKDFEVLSNNDFLFSFGCDGEIALTCEIDLITFKINGESFDITYYSYAGDNEENKKIIESLEDKDFSQEWVTLQLKNSGLVYAVALRNKCQEEKNRIRDFSEKRRNQITKKIEYLNDKIKYINEDEIRELSSIEEIEKLADKF